MSALERVRPARLRFRVRACRPLAAIALSSSQRDLVRADMAKWAKSLGIGPGVDSMSERDIVATVAATSPAFRNLLYYRLSRGPSAWTKLLVPLIRRIWRPLESLRFHPDSLGPGCFILHGFETTVAARSIGSNFQVGQHVVIGYSAVGKYATLGDNVKISVGAIVLGEIRIGDDVTVGAGAVVVRDVPSGVTVVGVPAHPVAKEHRRSP
jgi:serine O-acetyltransferase